MTINDATTGDAQAITQLMKSLGYLVSENAILDKLEAIAQSNSSANKVMVAVEDEVIIGILGLILLDPFHTKGKIGRITTLVFDESFRGNQAGKQLIQAAEDFFREMGCTSSEVSAAHSKSHARKLFQQQGYKEGDRQFVKNYRGK